MDTKSQYPRIIAICRELFINKTRDYGTAWQVLRLPSITDQLFIKAQRIRTLEEKGEAKVPEGVEDEFIGIVNYCVIAQIQLSRLKSQDADLPTELSLGEVAELYDAVVRETYALMEAKNHDYGEAWRSMRVASMTDLILMKLHRTKQIEDNQGKTLVSEGVQANYQDMMNYAIFALIKLGIADR